MEAQGLVILLITLISLHRVMAAPQDHLKSDRESRDNDVAPRTKRQIDSLGGSLIPGFVKKVCGNKLRCIMSRLRQAQKDGGPEEAVADSRVLVLPDSYYNRWAKRMIREARFDRIEQPTGLDF